MKIQSAPSDFWCESILGQIDCTQIRARTLKVGQHGESQTPSPAFQQNTRGEEKRALCKIGRGVVGFLLLLITFYVYMGCFSLLSLFFTLFTKKHPHTPPKVALLKPDNFPSSVVASDSTRLTIRCGVAPGCPQYRPYTNASICPHEGYLPPVDVRF